MNAYWGVPVVDGRVDDRFRRQNFNVSDNVMKSETYWLRLKAEWKPSDEVQVMNLAYGAIANRDWRNAEGFGFDSVTDRITFRDLGIIEHEQNVFGDRLETRFIHDLAGHENRLVVGGDFKRTEFFRLADFPSGGLTIDAGNPTRPTYAAASGAAGPSQRGADYTITQAGPFVEDQFSLLPNLRLVAGARYDYIQNDVENRDNGAEYGRDFNPITWRGGVVWEVVTNTTLYGQYSTSADSPRSFVNVGGAAFRGFNFALQKARQFEFGVKQSAWENRAEATLAYFNIEKDRLRTFRDGNERVSAPAGEQRSQGVELEGIVRPIEGWTLGANFTVLDADIRNPGSPDDRARPSNVPHHQAAVFTSYRFPFGLEIGADVRHVGNRMGNDPSGPQFTMDDYQLVGAYAAYAWRQFTLTVRGRNLTDKDYLAWSEDDYGNQAILGAPASVEIELRASF
jgi:iron complex outermembrane receptor protein